MKKGFAQVVTIAAIIIALIIVGFFAIKFFNKPASNTSSITSKNSSSTQLPQGNSNAVLDQSVNNIDSDLSQLDSDNASSEQGLNDQQIDLNQ